MLLAYKRVVCIFQLCSAKINISHDRYEVSLCIELQEAGRGVTGTTDWLVVQ